MLIDKDIDSEDELLSLSECGTVRIYGHLNVRCELDLPEVAIFAGSIVFQKPAIVNRIRAEGSGLKAHGALTGYYVKAWNIHVAGDLQAEYGIDSDFFIECGGSISAGGPLRCSGGVKAGGGIFADGISAGKRVQGEFIQTKHLPDSREFYAAQPPLAKWRDLILDTTKMCPDFLAAVSPAEAEEIAAWPGWSPLIAAQWRMYFKLTDRVYLPPGGLSGATPTSLS